MLLKFAFALSKKLEWNGNRRQWLTNVQKFTKMSDIKINKNKNQISKLLYHRLNFIRAKLETQSLKKMSAFKLWTQTMQGFGRRQRLQQLQGLH